MQGKIIHGLQSRKLKTKHKLAQMYYLADYNFKAAVMFIELIENVI